MTRSPKARVLVGSLLAIQLVGCNFDGSKSSKPSSGENSTKQDDSSKDSSVKELSLEETIAVDEICGKLQLSTSECTELKGLFRIQHSAIFPLRKMVSQLDVIASAYIGRQWVLATLHADALEKVANLKKQLLLAVGEINEEGKALVSIEIDVPGQLSPGQIILPLNVKAAVRVTGAYEGSTKKRDLSQLATYTEIINGQKKLEPDSISANVFKGLAETDSGKLAAKFVKSDGTVLESVANFKIAPTVAKKYSIEWFDVRDSMTPVTSISAGIYFTARLTAEFKDLQGSTIFKGVVSSELAGLSADGISFVPSENPEEQKFAVKSTQPLASDTLNVKVSLKSGDDFTAILGLKPPETVGYFFVGRSFSPPTYVMCQGGTNVVQANSSPELPILFIGSVVKPGLKALSSDCSSSDVTADYRISFLTRSTEPGQEKTFYASSATLGEDRLPIKSGSYLDVAFMDSKDTRPLLNDLKLRIESKIVTDLSVQLGSPMLPSRCEAADDYIDGLYYSGASDLQVNAPNMDPQVASFSAFIEFNSCLVRRVVAKAESGLAEDGIELSLRLAQETTEYDVSDVAQVGQGTSALQIEFLPTRPDAARAVVLNSRIDPKVHCHSLDHACMTSGPLQGAPLLVDVPTKPSQSCSLDMNIRVSNYLGKPAPKPKAHLVLPQSATKIHLISEIRIEGAFAPGALEFNSAVLPLNSPNSSYQLDNLVQIGTNLIKYRSSEPRNIWVSIHIFGAYQAQTCAASLDYPN